MTLHAHPFSPADPVVPATNDPATEPAIASVEIRGAGLSKAFGPVQVFDDVSLVAAPGHRLGIVGENGAGKSTLLAILCGTLEADLGDVHRPAGVGYLHQEFPFPPDTDVATVIEAALAPARAIEAELSAAASALGDVDDAGASRRYELALAAAERADVWNADHRADEVVTGLGLQRVDPGRTIGSLSGGERTRLELATLLIAHPPAMVLDEPTNHLDDEAIDFLTRFLVAFPGPVVTASHDRLFLEQVCTGIVDLDGGRDGAARTYGGSFERYLDLKAKERARWAQQYADEQDQLDRLRHDITHVAPNVAHNAPRTDNDKFIHHFKGGRVNNQISRRLRNARERLDELEERQVRRPPVALHFEAPTTTGTQSFEPLIGAVGVSVEHRLARVDVAVDAQTRLLVTGANGVGKSTLLAALARRTPTTTGTVTWRKGLRIGYLPQDVVFDDPDLTAERAFDAVARGVTLTDLGLLSGSDLSRPLGQLSVGQRRRVALGCIVANRPHVLVMDEPTNHLSLTLAEELEEALMTTLGAVIVASHDRWLRRRWDGDELRLERAGAGEEN